MQSVLISLVIKQGEKMVWSLRTDVCSSRSMCIHVCIFCVSERKKKRSTLSRLNGLFTSMLVGMPHEKLHCYVPKRQIDSPAVGPRNLPSTTRA